MGNGASKEEQHVFNADAPVRLSQSVLSSLQGNADSDSTRAKDVEHKIQSRVNAELKRIRAGQASQLERLTASLTTDRAEPSADEQPQHDPNSLLAHLSSPFYQDHSGGSKTSADSGRSHDSVHREVADLRSKLDLRKKLERVSPEVEKAKEELVSCLRTNDRRPLDCWQEVETFKTEVGKLEKAFIQKAAR